MALRNNEIIHGTKCSVVVRSDEPAAVTIIFSPEISTALYKRSDPRLELILKRRTDRPPVSGFFSGVVVDEWDYVSARWMEYNRVTSSLNALTNTSIDRPTIVLKAKCTVQPVTHVGFYFSKSLNWKSTRKKGKGGGKSTAKKQLFFTAFSELVKYSRSFTTYTLWTKIKMFEVQGIV